MKKIAILSILFFLFCLRMQAQDVSPVTVNVTAGNLSTLLGSQKNEITNLILKGEINGTDIEVIRSMTKLSVINIANTNIVAGGSFYIQTNGNISVENNIIPKYMFYNLNYLTSITLPNSIISIDYGSFAGCTGLISITIPSSVTSIGNGVFMGCTGLTTINISKSVTSIGRSAFSRCTGLTSITIPNNVITIDTWAFLDCTGLISVAIGNSVASIGESAFEGCASLKSISIPNSVTSIGDCTFWGCTGLTSAIIGNSVTSIDAQTFYHCTNLKEIIVDSSNPNLLSLDGVLFSKDKTKLITYPNAKLNTLYMIPNSVTTIGNAAFDSCTGLTSVTIGNIVTFIGDGAFENCSELKDIHCKAITPPNALTASDSFKGIDKINCKLYVPKETSAAYKSAAGWSDFKNIIEEESTAISQIEASNIKVYTEQDAIVISGAQLGDNISVYNECGAILQTFKSSDSIIRITAPVNHTYLVKVAGNTFKVAL